MATPLLDTKNVKTRYLKGAPKGTHCVAEGCGNRITEGAVIRAGIIRIRCRHCKKLNVITPENQYIVVE